MSYEEAREELDKLNKAASKILDMTDGLDKEIQTLSLLHNYLLAEPITSLDYIVKTTLQKYHLGEDPFPIFSEKEKIKAGAPTKPNTDKVKISYYLLKAGGSINKVSKLLGISRPTVRNKGSELYETVMEEGISEEIIKSLDKLYLDDFISDSKRLENYKNKK